MSPRQYRRKNRTYMEKISKKQLARNLSKTIDEDVGLKGLNTLIYGWLRWRKYGRKYRKVIGNRKWLYIVEVQDLSEYAGYDLSG